MDIDKNSFVPLHIQKVLQQSGWELTHSSLESGQKNLKIYPDGKIGMQTWKFGDQYQLDIFYDCTGTDKNVTLWYNDNDTEQFKIRNILGVLKRRELLERV